MPLHISVSLLGVTSVIHILPWLLPVSLYATLCGTITLNELFVTHTHSVYPVTGRLLERYDGIGHTQCIVFNPLLSSVQYISSS